MDRVDLSNFAPLPGPMRISPAPGPPAAEIARLRGAPADAIDFSAAARRLSQGAGSADPESARPASALVGARVPGAVSFDQAPASSAPAASLPFYRNPAQANLAATAIAGARLDITA